MARDLRILAKNGVELDPDDDAYGFVIAVAAGELDDVGEHAMALSSWQARARYRIIIAF